VAAAPAWVAPWAAQAWVVLAWAVLAVRRRRECSAVAAAPAAVDPAWVVLAVVPWVAVAAWVAPVAVAPAA
jgi:hypothetical protein